MESAGRTGELFRQLEATLDQLQEQSASSLSDEELLASNQLLFRAGQRLESARLGHLRELDGRAGAIPTARAGTVALSFTRHVLKRTEGDARADVAAARLLDPGLASSHGGAPRVAAAFAAGEVSTEHVRVIVRTWEQVPSKFWPVPAEDLSREPRPQDAGKCGGDLIDETLLANAKSHSPLHTNRVAAGLLQMLDPNGRDRFDENAHERRSFTHRTDSTGMVVGRFALDPATAASFLPVMGVLSAPRPAREETAQDGSVVTITDARTAGQRKVDALGEMSLRTADTLTDPLDHPHPSDPSDHAEPPSAGAPPRPTATVFDEGDGRDGDEGDGRDVGGGWDGRDARDGHERVRSLPGPRPGVDRPPGTKASTWKGRGPRSLTPRILIIATAEQVRDAAGPRCGCGTPPDPVPGQAQAQLYGPMNRAHLALSACDAVLQRVLLSDDGAALNLGRAVRTVTPPQKAALTARDEGCVIPGCLLPAEWCDAHHVRHWSAGGPSDLDNYALLCPAHHAQVHAGVWNVDMVDGVPWVRPPAWVDPQRRRIRNTFREHAKHARELGRRLRLALPSAAPTPGPPDQHPPEPPPPPRIPKHH